MSEPVIVCPHCNKKIPLNEAISHQIREELGKQFEKDAKKREAELISQFSEERSEIERKAKESAEEKTAFELKDLNRQLIDEKKKREDAEATELELRKKMREIEDREKNLDLEIERKLAEEKPKIEEKIANRIIEEQRFKDQEKEQLITQLTNQINDLKRKIEQGSQQLQGEVPELELEKILKNNFPSDTIEPVPKGVRGADVLQRVHNSSGIYCGTIIWESKRAKSWAKGWIPKLKADQREAKAEVAVIYTSVLPKGVSSFSFIEGVWVADYPSIFGLATALRFNLMQVSSVKLLSVSKNEKMELLYKYLSGPEFRQKVEGIAESVIAMQQDLEREKRAMVKSWSKRAKNLESVIYNTVGIVGDFQGIGASLPPMKVLEMEAASGNRKLLPSNDEEADLEE